VIAVYRMIALALRLDIVAAVVLVGSVLIGSPLARAEPALTPRRDHLRHETGPSPCADIR
jgi:hypothetical protein